MVKKEDIKITTEDPFSMAVKPDFTRKKDLDQYMAGDKILEVQVCDVVSATSKCSGDSYGECSRAPHIFPFLVRNPNTKGAETVNPAYCHPCCPLDIIAYLSCSLQGYHFGSRQKGHGSDA